MVEPRVDDCGLKLQKLWEWALHYQLHNFTRLLDLEAVADIVADHMDTHSIPEHASLQQIAMNRLRQLLNLEFLLLCDECGKPHNQDEITAPER